MVKIVNTINKNYLPEIDCLRAVAILLVVFFHFEISIFKSGYLGVDVFFVISGFLISKILVETKKEKNWLFNFYNKRFRRILPALYTTILLVLFLSFIQFTPIHLNRVSNSSISAIFGYSNFFFWHEAGYFDFEKNFKPLLHTWSLSVELQLYLIWSLIYFFIISRLKNFEYHVIIVIIALSLILSIIYSDRTSNFFYFTGFRIYEFAFGALSYYLIIHKKNKIYGDKCFLLGLTILIISSIIIDQSVNYNSFNSLIIVLATFLILLSINNLSYVRQYFVNKPLMLIGKISYSLYLIHWPIWIFFNYSLNFQHSIYYKALLIFISIILSYISYQYIEIIFRKKSKDFKFSLNNKKFILILIISVLILSFMSFNLVKIRNFENSLTKEQKLVITQLKESKLKAKTYSNEFNRKIFFEKKNNLPNILVFGDSHARDVFITLKKIDEINEITNIEFLSMSFSSCFGKKKDENYFINLIRSILKTRNEKKICTKLLNNKRILQTLNKSNIIIIVNRWFAYHDFNKINKFINENTSAKIIYINRIDRFFDPPTIILKNDINDVNKIALQKRNPEVSKVNKRMNKILTNNNTLFIDRSKFFCSKLGCTIYKDGRILFIDADHLSEDGYIYQSELFKKSSLLKYLRIKD